MSDAFKAFLDKREAEQQASANSQRWLWIIAIIAFIAVLAFVALRPDPSKQPLNPNTATAEQLATLPEVGPELAKAIIKQRTKKAFTKPEDLLEVKGIGPITLDKMKPRLQFE
jgi:competence ComEA-like helix-hairpin-helix protein